MSKKDFIALADALRKTKPRKPLDLTPEEVGRWEMVRDAIADVCAAANPAFKRDRWLDYTNGFCGPNGGKPK